MDMKRVQSSHVQKIGYEEETETLFVEYVGGELWRYRPVGPALWQQIQHSKSVGRILWASVRGVIPGERNALTADGSVVE